MILLFTDFGTEGPYLGQVEAVLRRAAPGVDVINLLSNAPPGEPRLSGYLLAALAREFAAGSVFLCVVDPGIGGKRLPVALRADGRWFVGPDNGLLNSVAAQAENTAWHQIIWRPARLSASFHGRDLFAPVVAQLAQGDLSGLGGGWQGPALVGWPQDLAAIIYFDHYGNAITGWRYRKDLDGRQMLLDGRAIPQARTFSACPEGAAFWYCNSIGLVEIAVNLGRADQVLGLRLGQGFGFDSVRSEPVEP